MRVAVQLVALVLVQVSGVAPYLPRLAFSALHPVECRGSHAECGCSAARVVSQTCCCYQSFHPCCVEARNPDAVAARAEGGGQPPGGRLSPSLRGAPCGSGARFLAPSPDRIDFTRSDAPRLAAATALPEAALPEVCRVTRRGSEPPVPPPKPEARG